MPEQSFDGILGKKIEADRIPVIFEQLSGQVKAGPFYQENFPLDKKVDEARERIKKEKPYFMIDSYASVSKEGFQVVSLDRVVGSVSPSFRFWGNEYSLRQGRHQVIVENLVEAVKSGDKEKVNGAFNRVFHLNDNMMSERIDLIRIQGPSGEVYFARDGTHRVSACKALELSFIPAEVQTGQIKELFSREIYDRAWWRLLERARLVRGEIKDDKIQIGESDFQDLYTLKIDQSVVPWISFSGKDFICFNQAYNELYPGAFSGLKDIDGESLPEEIFLRHEALTDFIFKS